MRAIGVAVISVVPLAAPLTAIADSFYCGNSIVSEDMTVAAIEARCGRPALVESLDVPVFARLENGTVLQVGIETKEFWYYDRGPNRFVAQITVEASKAVRIELMNVRDIESVRRDPMRGQGDALLRR